MTEILSHRIHKKIKKCNKKITHYFQNTKSSNQSNSCGTATTPNSTNYAKTTNNIIRLALRIIELP